MEYSFQCANFYETDNHPINFCRHLLLQILSTLDKNVENMGKMLFTPLSMFLLGSGKGLAALHADHVHHTSLKLAKKIWNTRAEIHVRPQVTHNHH
jgi:hypothetical protein